MFKVEGEEEKKPEPLNLGDGAALKRALDDAAVQARCAPAARCGGALERRWMDGTAVLADCGATAPAQLGRPLNRVRRSPEPGRQAARGTPAPASPRTAPTHRWWRTPAAGWTTAWWTPRSRWACWRERRARATAARRPAPVPLGWRCRSRRRRRWQPARAAACRTSTGPSRCLHAHSAFRCVPVLPLAQLRRGGAGAVLPQGPPPQLLRGGRLRGVLRSAVGPHVA